MEFLRPVSLFLIKSATYGHRNHSWSPCWSTPWLCCSQTTEDSKQEKQDKKNEQQPPQAKKPKVKTKTVELPVESKQPWQLTTDVLNMFVENEVTLQEAIN